MQKANIDKNVKASEKAENVKDGKVAMKAKKNKTYKQ